MTVKIRSLLARDSAKLIILNAMGENIAFFRYWRGSSLETAGYYFCLTLKILFQTDQLLWEKVVDFSALKIRIAAQICGPSVGPLVLRVGVFLAVVLGHVIDSWRVFEYTLFTINQP